MLKSASGETLNLTDHDYGDLGINNGYVMKDPDNLSHLQFFFPANDRQVQTYGMRRAADGIHWELVSLGDEYLYDIELRGDQKYSDFIQTPREDERA